MVTGGGRPTMKFSDFVKKHKLNADRANQFHAMLTAQNQKNNEGEMEPGAMHFKNLPRSDYISKSMYPTQDQHKRDDLMAGMSPEQQIETLEQLEHNTNLYLE